MNKLLKWLEIGTPVYHLTKVKLYRKLVGGKWICYFPKMFPYMTLWDREENYLDVPHHVIIKKEDWRRTK